jgi:restriction system protein
LTKIFSGFSDLIKIDIDEISTKINVNSPGKIKLAGPVLAISAMGMILVCRNGGG